MAFASNSDYAVNNDPNPILVEIRRDVEKQGYVPSYTGEFEWLMDYIVNDELYKLVNAYGAEETAHALRVLGRLSKMEVAS